MFFLLVSEREEPTSDKKSAPEKVTVKRSQNFVTLPDALEHKFTGLTRRKKSRMNPVLFGVFGALVSE
jgi:hypothetical protein